MKLCVFKEVATRTPAARLKLLFDLVCRGERVAGKPGCVNLVFVSDARIRELNGQFRSLDKATDVLSFNLDEPEDAEDVYGEVYVSQPTASRQALEFETTLAVEYLRLACHGFLHLLGYDHKEPAERETMRGLEDRYLTRLRDKGRPC